MLSFLQDNNRDDVMVNSSGPEGADAEPNEDEYTDEQDYLAPAEHGKNAKRRCTLFKKMVDRHAALGSACINYACYFRHIVSRSFGAGISGYSKIYHGSIGHDDTAFGRQYFERCL